MSKKIKFTGFDAGVNAETLILSLYPNNEDVKFLKLIENQEVTISNSDYNNLPESLFTDGTIVLLEDKLSINAKEFNVIGDGVADDTVAIQNAINAATNAKLPLFLPAGTYKITAGLTAPVRNFMMYGAGGTLTKIVPDTYTFDVLTIGTAAGSVPIGSSGYLKDIFIEGKTTYYSTDYWTGVKLVSTRQFNVENVTVHKMSIGFDLISNCYGTVFNNCRAMLGAVGVNLRSGPESGSDLNFYGGWFSGVVAAVHMSPDGGGYHFFGGQFSGGANLSSDQDLLGSIIIGKDYITGAVGITPNVIFDGIDFEGAKYMHAIRCFGQTTLTIRNCSFLQTDSSAPGLLAAPLSIIKSDNAVQSQIIFDNNGVKGYWKSVKAFDITGQGSVCYVQETGTVLESNVKFNNVSVGNGTPLMVQSQCSLGSAFWRSGSAPKVLMGSVISRMTSGKLEKSYDWGTTWNTEIPSGTTAARPTTTAIMYAGYMYFDTTLGKPIWRNTANTGWVDSAGTTV
ncbi:MAG: hypothetical protein K0R18_492 [Bacillales bacterium]|jgi:hypothetical protein|nr:hypothetical protein [Bacillales bacterium]